MTKQKLNIAMIGSGFIGKVHSNAFRQVGHGFGARVRVNGQTRFATSAGSYASSNDKRLHFGLGTAEKANVEVVWPSGIHQTLNEVHADQLLEVREPEKP